jgi:hypothetical protein
MNTIQANTVLDLLKRLERLLISEGEDNWIRGIRSSIAILESAGSDDAESSKALNEVASIYKTMYAGAGSFSDFFLWRDDEAERIEANKELDNLRDELWTALVGDN